MILPSDGSRQRTHYVFFTQTHLGYKFIALSSIAIAVIGFLVWAPTIVVAGISLYAA